MIIIYTTFYLYFILADLIPLKESGENSYFWLYLSTLSAAYILTFALALDIEIPSPAKLIQTILRPLIGS